MGRSVRLRIDSALGTAASMLCMHERVSTLSCLLAAWAGRPYVFNLGHGINPDVPPDHVTRLVNRVRGL